MNQILSVNNTPKVNTKKEMKKNNYSKNNGPLEVNSIVKFFAIAILAFGICVIGVGSYSMYREVSSGTSKTRPVIYVQTISETEISLKITHDSALSTVTYQWNEDEATEIPCNGKTEITQTIEVPEGTNALTVYAVDNYGQEIEYKKVYTIDSKISINVEPETNNLKVTATGKATLSYMTYRWDEDEETKIDINDTSTETSIEIPKGLHKLTIIVVDENNETKTFEKEVEGVTKPTVQVTTDGSSNFVIKAKDENGLTRVEFIINETEKYALDLERVLSLEERKDFEYSYPLHEGENKIEVTVYNVDGVSETFRALVNM